MSNMSYCRFQNTVSDLDDCKDSLERLLDCAVDEDGDITLSSDELRAAKRLIKKCLDIVALVADHANIDIDVDEIEGCVPEILDDAQREASEQQNLESSVS